MNIKAFREALKRMGKAERLKANIGRLNEEIRRLAQTGMPLVIDGKLASVPLTTNAWFNQPRDAKGRFAKRTA